MNNAENDYALDVATSAELLSEEYTEDALLGLLEAQQNRLSAEANVTLGASPKELANGAWEFVSQRILYNQRIVTKAIFMTYVVNSVIEYLISENIISAGSVERERFVITLVTAIIIDALYKEWESRRDQLPK